MNPKEKTIEHLTNAKSNIDEALKILSSTVISVGVSKIGKERFEQITKHNRTVDYDAKTNKPGDLTNGAVALLIENPGFFPGHWDKKICDHMLSKSFEKRVIIAGAFCAAELDKIAHTA